MHNRQRPRQKANQQDEAADGWVDLHVLQLPDLEAHARRMDEIPDVIRDAAARLTGRPKNDFNVEVRY